MPSVFILGFSPTLIILVQMKGVKLFHLSSETPSKTDAKSLCTEKGFI